MKRKIGISLGHLRMPKVETEDLEARLSRAYSPPASPFIDCRPLSPTTEAELKAACAIVARDYKPTEEEIQERKQADVRAAQIARSQREDAVRKQQREKYASHKYDGVPGAAPNSSRYLARTTSAWNDSVKEPTHSRQPPATANGDKPGDLRQMKSSSSVYPPRRSSLLPPPPENSAVPAETSEAHYHAAALRQSSDSAPSTPRSASTDLRFGHPSTDQTSVAWSPPRSSKHTSRSHLPIESIPGPRTNPVSDAWFYREYKRGTPPEVSRPDTGNLKQIRSQSRGRRIKNQLEEYVKPSLANNSTVSLGRKSRPTSQIWRSWGSSKRASQPDLANVRGSASQFVRSETNLRGRAKDQLDLNRELPPLPSLDKWREQQQDQSSYNHVVALMKGRSRSRSRGRSSTKHNTQAFMSMPDLHDGQESGTGQAVTLRAFVHSKTDPHSTAQENASRTLDRLTGHKDAYDRYVSNASGQRVDSAQQKGHNRQMTNSSSGSDARNFSRKISHDQHNFIDVTALPSMPPVPQPPRTPSAGVGEKKGGNGFTKILGRFSRSRAATRSRPAKADGNWMDQIEAQSGVKGGVLEFDEAAGAPYIRY